MFVDVSEFLLRKWYDFIVVLEEFLEVLDKVFLFLDKFVVKVELDQIIWFSVDFVVEEDFKEIILFKVVVNGFGVFILEFKEMILFEVVVNGFDVKEVVVNGVFYQIFL